MVVWKAGAWVQSRPMERWALFALRVTVLKRAYLILIFGGKFDIKIEHTRVLDIFAGTGALGVEAISRGAKTCTFIEKNKACLQILKANIDLCNIEDHTTIKICDATKIPLNSDQPYDLVF